LFRKLAQNLGKVAGGEFGHSTRAGNRFR
jgi:hypothetical protein